MTRQEHANRRLAARLGLTLPSAADVQEDTSGVWSSGGNDTLYEGETGRAGETRLDFVQGRWAVTLLGLKGRRSTHVGTFGSLDSAMATARFLQTKSGRRAYRGLRPKGERLQTSPAPEGSLRELLQSVNGGAVTVR